MKYITASLWICLFFLPAASARAQSQGNNGNANVCNPMNGSAQTDLLRSTFGVNNASTTESAEVECPVNLTHVIGDAFIAHVYSRNSSVALTCTLYELNPDGSVIAMLPQTIAGVPSSSVKSIVWLSPPLSPNMVVDCTIPPFTPLGWFSAVAWFGWEIS